VTVWDSFWLQPQSGEERLFKLNRSTGRIEVEDEEPFNTPVVKLALRVYSYSLLMWKINASEAMIVFAGYSSFHNLRTWQSTECKPETGSRFSLPTEYQPQLLVADWAVVSTKKCLWVDGVFYFLSLVYTLCSAKCKDCENCCSSIRICFISKGVL
jgi:hypothetical protein